MHILLLIISTSVFGQENTLKETDYLYLIWNTVPNERYGYVNFNGDTIIPFDKYNICYSDTIKQFGVVLKDKTGFVGIDKQENVLFEIFPFDNGPDIPSEGFFRIIKKGKIGYANSKGQIIIDAQYDCAYPFNNGFAKVSKDCEEIKEGEHFRWSGEWFYIDTLGNRITEDIVQDYTSYYDKSNNRVIYNFTDSMPRITQEFLHRLLNLNINEPVEFIDTKGIISFVIETNGTVSNIKILDSVSNDIDKQIIKIVSEWKNIPIGYCQGVPVPIEIKIPYHIDYQ